MPTNSLTNPKENRLLMTAACLRHCRRALVKLHTCCLKIGANSLFYRDVISENSILGDMRCAGAWGINADFIGVSPTVEMHKACWTSLSVV